MNELLIEAAVLLGVGMSVVFAFLSMLIGGIKLIAWYAAKYPSPTQTNIIHNKNNVLPTTTVKPDIVAAISAAVHIHQQKQH
ncbi:OadG family protein [Glaciecola sp. SC05]|uniref:OadG family protein n=1 Tax=Glaciecola sp. SC05 TaxID=1987355 RepID=UPI00352875FD